jgi:hypothetical protein
MAVVKYLVMNRLTILQENDFFSNGHLNFTGIYHSTFGIATTDSAAAGNTVATCSDKPSEDARFDWPGLLTARARDAIPHVNDGATLMRTASQIYANIFSNFVSHYRNRLFDNSTSNEAVPGLNFSREARMVASIPMFSITLGLLMLYAMSVPKS